MARKRIVVKPTEPLEIEFSDGTVKEAIFTVEAFMLMQEEFGDLSTLAKEESNKPYDLASKILYCGMKILDNDVKYEEVKSIVIGGGLPLIETILECTLESFEGIDNDEVKKKVQTELLKLSQKQK